MGKTRRRRPTREFPDEVNYDEEINSEEFYFDGESYYERD